MMIIVNIRDNRLLVPLKFLHKSTKEELFGRMVISGWHSVFEYSSYLAMTGIERLEAISCITESRFECCGRSFSVRPCTVMALTPHSSMALQNFNVSEVSSKTRILQVTGILTFCFTLVTILRAFGRFDNRAAPIPPEIEKCLGHPIFMSIPATSFSLKQKYQVRLCDSRYKMIEKNLTR